MNKQTNKHTSEQATAPIKTQLTKTTNQHTNKPMHEHTNT